MDIETESFVAGDDLLADYKGGTLIDDIDPFLDDYKNVDTNDNSAQPITTNISQGTNYLRYFLTLQYFICLTSRSKSPKVSIGFKPPKREYVRTRLIRGHKRAIRQSLTCQLPQKTITKVNPNNSSQMDAWREFKTFNQRHIKFLDAISKTEEGPKTDGKNKRHEGVRAKENTCNNPFCKAYFLEPHVQESFKLYAKVLFENQTPDDYSEKFGFSCCERKLPHNERCKELWSQFECEVKHQFIEVLLRSQINEEA